MFSSEPTRNDQATPMTRRIFLAGGITAAASWLFSPYA